MFKEKILYRLEQSPNFFSQLSLGIQYIVKFSLLVICPLLIVKAAGAPPAMLINVISLTFLVAGIITLIFATKKLGGGYFLPTQASVPFFALSLTAAKIGGLGLVVGTAFVSACMGLLLSPFIARFKGRSAMELSASILFIMGIWAAQLGVNELFHPGSLGLLMVHGHFFTYKTFNIGAAIPGFITLVLLLSLASWRHYRLHCILYALVIGGVISWMMGAAPSLPQNISKQLPWFAVPHFFPIHPYNSRARYSCLVCW